MKIKFLFSAAALSLFFFSCQDANNIGEDLLSNEKLDLNYQTSFEMSAMTIPGEDVIGFTYTTSTTTGTNLVTPNTGLIGDINDPVFGNLKASFLPIGLQSQSIGTFI
ncbi:MAG: hypothetical protein IPP37_11245 [Saprospiraceae bacterium]|nr:hypothetical protein [Saprospiraceae bacterium]